MHSTWLICCLAIASDPAPLTIDAALLTIAQQAEVPARDAGILAEISVREGQIVNIGQPLARLDDTDARLGYGKATLDLQRARKLSGNDIKVRQAQKDLEFAKAELQRAVHAEGKLPGSVSDAERDRLRLNMQRSTLDLEQAEFELDAAKLAVSAYENELKLAEEKLQRRRIVSPISGVVVAIPKRLGEWAEPGQQVVRVLAIDKLRVEFFLMSDQALPELVGKTVKFTLLNAARNAALWPVSDRATSASRARSETGPSAPSPSEPSPFTGRVSFVSPEVDPLNRQVRVWAEIENLDGRLRPGLTGALSIIP